MASKLGIHFFDSLIVAESRLFKLSQSLIETGAVDRIVVAGVWGLGLPRIAWIDRNRLVIRAKLLNDRGFARRIRTRSVLLRRVVTLLSVLVRQVGLLRLAIERRPKLICCHNLGLLPVACLAKWFTRCALYYVPHELETERTGLKYVLLARGTERLCIRFVNHTIVVSPYIRDWYRTAYSTEEVTSIRNVPINPRLGRRFRKSTVLRERLGMSLDALVFIYQGLIDEYRGVDCLLEQFAFSHEHHIVFMGFGSSVPKVQEFARRYDNIHYHEAVPMDQIVGMCSAADVGLLFVPDPCSLSYRYTTANKMFEYAIAEVPVLISSNFEYMSSVVLGHGLGWVISPSAQELAQFIARLSRKDVEAMRNTVREYGRRIDWFSEASPLLSIIERGVSPAGAS